MCHYLCQCYGVKAHVTGSKPESNTGPNQRHRSGGYQKPFDGRKNPIRGLWQRDGGRYYARLAIRNPTTGKNEVRRIPLGSPDNPVNSVPQAVAALRRLKTRREDDNLPVLQRTPKFADCVASYFDYLNKVPDLKRPATIAKESGILLLWQKHLGDIRVDRINPAMINDFKAKRQSAGISGRTVNLDIGALRNVLNFARDNGWLKTLPTENMRPFKENVKKRELVTAEDFTALCETALLMKTDGSPVTKNGRQFVDYVKLLAYSGARRNEALSLKWDDVNWQAEQLIIGADGKTKNREMRVVDFNGKLQDHLKEMLTRRAPDSVWLFPSPQRGTKDIHAKSFMESLKLVRAAVAKDRPRLKTLGFHDLRHFFISYCVMSPVDYMTIAKWVGHKDGGILIGKVYGHLTNEHVRRQARKVNF